MPLRQAVVRSIFAVPMNDETVIYGHSRGYRVLAAFSALALTLSFSAVVGYSGGNPVAIAGTVGFGYLTVYAWRRCSRRIEVMRITDVGFNVTDPAQPLGLIRYEEIEELRIYALHSVPTVGIRLTEPDHIRRRGPAIMRLITKPIWMLRHYQVILELDGLNDQVAAIKSVAVKMGIPIRSELL